MKNKWKVLETKEIFSTKFFKFRSDRCLFPDKREMPNYYVMEFSPWVNVIPVTEDGRIICIEQYRHAAGITTIEVPGGAMDPGEESPEHAGLRELAEETGFVPDEIRLVGKHYPNPALQNNQMYTYVALNCRKEKEVDLDPFEDIKVVPYTVGELMEAVNAGKVQHSIILASIFLALPYLGVRG